LCAAAKEVRSWTDGRTTFKSESIEKYDFGPSRRQAKAVDFGSGRMDSSIEFPDDATKRFSVLVSFHGDLDFFLKNKDGLEPQRVLTHKASVKDVIESFGVPHPEVDAIFVNRQPVDFFFQLNADATIDVYPVSSAVFSTIRLQAREARAFVADGHLGKLTRDLRLLGIDVSYNRDADDRELLRTMAQENRALLTRDRLLLMHRIVSAGYFPRSQDPMEQSVEVIRRFGLAQAVNPFVRCLRCNGLLAVVPKEAVVDQLEPLTRLYYNDFRRCPECGQSYWRGSHITKLESRVEAILSRIR
jgi:uncharacterized protein